MSVIGQQNLSKSQNALQTSMERLSSGLRINSAKDGISKVLGENVGETIEIKKRC